MGGRGRGGRGRGRGMTLEQLGVQRGEILPDNVVGPPETYPPLEFHPCQPPQKESVEQYILCIKKEFQEHMQNSEYFIKPEVKCPDIERYSDRYQVLTNRRGRLSFNWSRFPKELHPVAPAVSTKRKKKGKKVAPNLNNKKSRTKDINVKETLEKLEEKEAMNNVDDNEEEEGEEEEDLENKVTERVDEELEEVDEELDDGTDYINNYFDNGENYLDEEDDALEEGGVF